MGFWCDRVFLSQVDFSAVMQRARFQLIRG